MVYAARRSFRPPFFPPAARRMPHATRRSPFFPLAACHTPLAARRSSLHKGIAYLLKNRK